MRERFFNAAEILQGRRIETNPLFSLLEIELFKFFNLSTRPLARGCAGLSTGTFVERLNNLKNLSLSIVDQRVGFAASAVKFLEGFEEFGSGRNKGGGGVKSLERFERRPVPPSRDIFCEIGDFDRRDLRG